MSETCQLKMTVLRHEILTACFRSVYVSRGRLAMMDQHPRAGAARMTGLAHRLSGSLREAPRDRCQGDPPHKHHRLGGARPRSCTILSVRDGKARALQETL